MLECPAMSISFSDRVKIPDGVLISKLQEESVILNLDSERYYGLDDVGTRILTVLTTSESIEAAYETLVNEYDVDAQVLRQDLLELVEELVASGTHKNQYQPVKIRVSAFDHCQRSHRWT